MFSCGVVCATRAHIRLCSRVSCAPRDFCGWWNLFGFDHATFMQSSNRGASYVVYRTRCIDFKLERRAGIFVLDALVESGRPAFHEKMDSRGGLDIQKFFQAFASNITIKNRPVWKAASKVFGTILRKEEESAAEDARFVRSFSRIECISSVRSIVTKQLMGSDLAKAVEVMHRIANEYPVLCFIFSSPPSAWSHLLLGVQAADKSRLWFFDDSRRHKNTARIQNAEHLDYGQS